MKNQKSVKSPWPVQWLLIVLFGSMVVHSNTARIYRDRQNGFTIRFPQGWTVQGHPTSSSLIKADLVSEDGKTGLQIRIYPSRFQEFSGFVDWYTRQFQKEMPKTSLMDKDYRPIGAFPGCEIRFDARRRNGYFLKSHLIPDGKRVFVFQSGTPYAWKDKNEPLLDSIADSFETE